LAPLPEADATDQSIRNASPRQHVLERARLGVGSVQDREVGVRAPIDLAQALALVGDELRLLHLVVGLRRAHLLAAGSRGPQALFRSLRVAADDAVGGVEDGLARAVVLRQPDHLSIRIVL